MGLTLGGIGDGEGGVTSGGEDGVISGTLSGVISGTPGPGVEGTCGVGAGGAEGGVAGGCGTSGVAGGVAGSFGMVGVGCVGWLGVIGSDIGRFLLLSGSRPPRRGALQGERRGRAKDPGGPAFPRPGAWLAQDAARHVTSAPICPTSGHDPSSAIWFLGWNALPDNVPPVRFVAKNMRLDLRLIAEMIPEDARVLDIGCGDGALLDHLTREKGADARGIEIDMAEVARAVGQGLAVIHGDADNDLAFYPDRAFDYVVLSRTFQAVEKPREVLAQMLRIGSRAVVSFPNFGHWLLRWKLLVKGRMPDTETWNRPWYETPNIHPCTMLDFIALCEMEGYIVEQWLAVDEHGLRAPWRRSLRLANLFGEQALFVLRRADTPAR